MLYFAQFVAGWFVWSMGHNLGHRWWHDDMKQGKKNFYAHGESEHHRIYDRHGEVSFQRAEDPRERFISFPVAIVGSAGALLVIGYGFVFGWGNAGAFALGFGGFMFLDHQVHKLFHRKSRIGGIVGWFQQLHMVHHQTHNSNFFFVSGILWDLLFGTLNTDSTRRDVAVTHR